MKPQTQLDTPRKTQEIFSAMESQERFTGRSINIVVIVLTIIAYIPLFLDQTFYAAPPWLIVTILGLGMVYLFMGTWGMMQCEVSPWRYVFVFYFGVQILLLLVLFLLTNDFNHNFWLLILPVGAQSMGFFWRGTAVVCSLLLLNIWIGFNLSANDLRSVIFTFVGIGSALLFTLVFTHIALRETDSRREIQRLASDLRDANLRLAEYAAQVEELATTKERNRLAREIHDNLGHYLTVIHVQIEAARVTMDDQPAKAHDALDKAQRLTQEGLGAIRQSITALRESPLANHSLVEAVAQLAAESQNAGLPTELMVKGEPIILDPKVSLTLYRAAQEGLTNIRKHARASRAVVVIDFQDTDWVHMMVQDNGVGTAVSDSAGFGLIGIQERVNLLNGRFELQTAPGNGCTLFLSIPRQIDPPTHLPPAS